MRQRRVKTGQIVVDLTGYVTLQHDDPLGRSYSTVKVDSAAFRAWLDGEANTSFTVDIPAAPYVVRAETRRGKGRFWYAFHRPQDGKLRKVYIGKSEAITWARLKDIARAFAPPPPFAQEGG